MRHVYANRAALVLALFLVASAALFGWWRSQGLALVVLVDEERIAAITDEAGGDETGEEEGAEAEADDEGGGEADDAAGAEADEAADWAWEDLGERTYARECSSCHGRLPHVPSLAAAEGGRGYLVDFLLYGFDGEAVIDGAAQSLDHLAFGELGDDEVAAVLDHMLATFGEGGPPEVVELYRPDEIRGARGRDLSPKEVASSRPMD